MTWATDRRLDYIDWVLMRRGSLSRRDLTSMFGVSPNQATHDIAAFEAAHPDRLRYDTSAKRYYAAPGYTSARGLDAPDVAAAIDQLARSGHPMGWRIDP